MVENIFKLIKQNQQRIISIEEHLHTKQLLFNLYKTNNSIRNIEFIFLSCQQQEQKKDYHYHGLICLQSKSLGLSKKKTLPNHL